MSFVAVPGFATRPPYTWREQFANLTLDYGSIRVDSNTNANQYVSFTLFGGGVFTQPFDDPPYDQCAALQFNSQSLDIFSLDPTADSRCVNFRTLPSFYGLPNPTDSENGSVTFLGVTSSSAVAGTVGTLPASVDGYICAVIWTGSAYEWRKIPYFND